MYMKEHCNLLITPQNLVIRFKIAEIINTYKGLMALSYLLIHIFENI